MLHQLQLPDSLEVVVEVLKDVNRIEHQEEQRICVRVWNEQLKVPVAELGEELDVDFVPITQGDFYIKTNFLQFCEDGSEMLKQGLWSQVGCRDEAHKVLIVAVKGRDEEGQKRFGRNFILMTKELAANVFNSLCSEDLREIRNMFHKV